MKISSYMRTMLIALSLTLAGCTSMNAMTSASNPYTSDWKGWSSVLQIVVDTLVAADGTPLVTIQEVQASKSGESQRREMTETEMQSFQALAAEGITPTVSMIQGDIQLSIFAKDELRSVQLKNVPMDQNGVPTAASYNQVKNASLAFRNQVFPEADGMTNPTAPPAESSMLRSPGAVSNSDDADISSVIEAQINAEQNAN